MALKFREVKARRGQSAPASFHPPLSSRFPAFVGLPGMATERLAELRVAILGAGAVGRNLASHCARLQPDAMWIVDPGRYKFESLLTQSILACDIGEWKATSTGRACKAISPRTHVFTLVEQLQSVDKSELSAVDVVLLATDNLRGEVAASQLCIDLGKPLIQASVHGDTLVAQVRCLSNRDGTGPCLACGFGPTEWSDFDRETKFSCSGELHGAQGQGGASPTMSVSSLCSMAADLALMQLLRVVLNLGDPVSDSLLEYCGYTHTTTQMPLVRNPSCPCSHLMWSPAAAPRAVAKCSLRELAAAGGFGPLEAVQDVSFVVGNTVFVEAAMCCGTTQPVRRFAVNPQSLGNCQNCGAALRPDSFFILARVSAAMLGSLVDHPLQRIGARAARWVAVLSETRAVWIR